MKKGFMLFTLLAAFSGFVQADDAAIQQTGDAANLLI